ncbi:cytochrome P450 736A117-like [Cornus florida]|uniref:cytochrome P450 736A117-like n=1 Tax=Cornus florida TaxID=4283 RepID=UPI0028A19B55|nr:cytochrome P450 736A117-like [Cornus florida]
MLLQTSYGQDLEFNGGVGVVDQRFGSDQVGVVASGGANLMQAVNLSLPSLGFSQGFNNEKIGLLLKLLSNSKALRNPPPSPSKLPIIGNLHQLGLLSHRSLQTLAQQYGPLMLLHLGSKPALIVSSADAAREIMKTHDVNFATRPKSSIPMKLFYDKDVAFGSYGEYWRQLRSICVFQLLNNKRVQSFRRVREEETSLLLEKIEQSSSSSVNLTEMLISLTNDVLCRIVLGKKYSEREGERKLRELFRDFMEILAVFNVGEHIPWLAWLNSINGLNAKVEKVAKELDNFLEDAVEEHMDRLKPERDGGGNDEGREDFLDILLGIQREKSTSFPIHRDSIKGVILDMFAAGTETTYTTLEWEMIELLRHPKVMKELQNEVRGIAKGKEDIVEDDLEKMHYLKAVIKESMRLHPPIPLLIPREAIKDVKVMDYDIAAGTKVFINAWAISRDSTLWEDAEEFQPERFLNTSVDYKGQDFQFTPFGAGRRGCPGIHFAKSVYELALAKLVHKFDFALPDGAKGQDMDMTEAPGITLNRKNPLLVVATPYSC